LAPTTFSKGGTDGAQFTLSGNTLSVGTSPSGCPRSYSVDITATLAGAAGSPRTQTFTITGNAVTAGCLSGSICPPCPGGCTWTLAWGDEFNGSSLDMTHWNIQIADGGTIDNGQYTQNCLGQNGQPPPGAIQVSGGALAIRALALNVECTIRSVGATFGPKAYYEVREWADASGSDDVYLWLFNPGLTGPAGQNGSYWFGPNFIETFGGGGRNGQMQADNDTFYGPNSGNLADGYHIAGFLWEPYPNYNGGSYNTYTFYLNGVQRMNGNFDNCTSSNHVTAPPHTCICTTSLYTTLVIQRPGLE